MYKASQAESNLDWSEPTVEEMMNPDVLVFRDDTTIRDAVRQLLDRRVSGAPVVDGSGKLVGVISESDILWKEAGGPEPHYIVPPVYLGLIDAFVYLRNEAQYKEECHKFLARTVGEAMTLHPVSVPPSMTLQEAAKLMLSKKVTRLPVCEGAKLVGMLTRSDILRGALAANLL